MRDMSTSNRFAPRSEAQVPLKYAELSKEQRSAIMQLHRWAGEFLDATQNPPSQERLQRQTKIQFLPSLRTQRPSNVVLLDGARGSGKTTVMLTLLALWAEALQQKGTDGNSIPRLLDDALADIGQQDAVAGQVARQLAGRIIPVRILDMQPLGRPPSLLQQLATRLYPIVQACWHKALPDSGGQRLKTPPPRMPGTGSEPNSVVAWRQLLRAVASGTELDLRRRRLTPENLAVELEETERERANVLERWEVFVNEVLSDASKHLTSELKLAADPCLVIPIDDADMNPDQCVELLQLIRSLWHPRVIFLLTGDSELFVQRLHASFGRGAMARSEPSPRTLAAQAYDKIVPPHHRLVIFAQPAESRERLLNVLPLHLVAALRRIPSLSAALPMLWREIIDLEHLLGNQRLQPAELVKRIFDATVAEADLPRRVKAHLREEVVQWDNEEQLLVNDGQLQLHPMCHIDTWPVDRERELRVYKVFNEEMHLVVDGAPAGPQVPGRVRAAIYLAATLPTSQGRLGPLPGLSPANFPFAASVYYLNRREFRFVWPVPVWQEPADFLWFREKWQMLRRAIEGAPDIVTPQRAEGGPTDRAARLIYAYLCCMCAIAEADGSQTDLTEDIESALNTQLQWQHLGERLAQLTHKQRSPREQCFALWARGPAVLFTLPQYGLQQAFADLLFWGWLEGLGLPDEPDYCDAVYHASIANKESMVASLVEHNQVPNVQRDWLLDAADQILKPPAAKRIRSLYGQSEGANDRILDLIMRNHVENGKYKALVILQEWDASRSLHLSATAWPVHIENKLREVQLTHPPASSARQPTRLSSYPLSDVLRKVVLLTRSPADRRSLFLDLGQARGPGRAQDALVNILKWLLRGTELREDDIARIMETVASLMKERHKRLDRRPWPQSRTSCHSPR